MAIARTPDGKPTGQKMITPEQSAAKQRWDERQSKKRSTRERNIIARNKRSSQEQIKRLDDIFGKGQGAKRERARLAKLMQK